MHRLILLSLSLIPLWLSGQSLRHIPGVQFLDLQIATLPQAATPYKYQLKAAYGYYQDRRLSLQAGLLGEKFQYQREFEIGLVDAAGDSLFSLSSERINYQALHAFVSGHYTFLSVDEQLFLNVMAGLRGGYESAQASSPDVRPKAQFSWGVMLAPEAELYLGSQFALVARLQGELLLNTALQTRLSPSLSFRFCFKP
ncbi:MAG: hypothetical protein AAFN10_08515 [Bacteroidota bacterium]